MACGLLPWRPRGRPYPAMPEHRTRFLRLALDAEALRFGAFTLKSELAKASLGEEG